MKTETLLPATVAECERVLERFPDLSASGFDSYFVAADARENARRARDGLPPRIREPTKSLIDGDARQWIARARAFLQANCWQTKTIRRKSTYYSYTLKHCAERWVRETFARSAEVPYVSNGALIAAAHLEGYTIEPCDHCAFFNLSFTRDYRISLRQRYRPYPSRGF